MLLYSCTNLNTMFLLSVVIGLIYTVSAFEPIQVVASTPPPVTNCPNTLCRGRRNGNYEINGRPNYFVQCIRGQASCQACWPLHLQFTERCNQCLWNRNNACIKTNAWVPITTYECPDLCSQRGPRFSGNMVDPNNRRQYLACWQGTTRGCVICPGSLEFNEKWNACLIQGKLKPRSISGR